MAGSSLVTSRYTFRIPLRDGYALFNTSSGSVLRLAGRDADELSALLSGSRVLIPGAPWGRNLDAFNDILRGGFGTPDGGFILRWKNAQVSRDRLGYPETVRQLEVRLARCHPLNRELVARDLARAREWLGPTVRLAGGGHPGPWCGWSRAGGRGGVGP